MTELTVRDLRAGSGEREVREPQAGTAFSSRTYTTAPGSPMLADWDAEDAIRRGYYSNVYVWACVRALAEDVAALTFRAGLDQDDPAKWSVDSPLAKLLGSPPHGPNRYTTGRQLVAWSVAQLLVTGRFAWELAYPKARGKTAPESLWPLSASRFEPVPSKRPGKYFDHFLFNRGTGQEVKLAEEQAFYYWRPSQHDWRQPESVLQAARLDVSVAVMQDRYDYAFLRNDARPAAVVVHQRFSEAGAKEAFREQFLSSHAGPDNAGRVAFVETSDDGALPKESLLVQQIGLSQRDAQFIERYDRKIRAIIVAFGVPISRLGDSSERTYSNASVEYQVYLRDRVKPLARELADAINLQLAPRLGRELGWFDTTKIDDAVRGDTLRNAGLPELLKTRVVKINEARHALELEPVEGGDRFLSDIELGLLQQGAATLVIPESSSSAAPYERGQEETESPPPVPAPEPAPAPEPPVEEPALTPPEAKAEGRTAENRTRTARETRRLRAYAAVDRRVREHEAAVEKAFQGVLDAQLAHVLSRLTGKRGRQMLRVGAEGRQAALDPSVIFDRKRWLRDTVNALLELLGGISEEAATALAEALSIDLGLSSNWAEEFILSRANQLAGHVTDTTYAGIQDALAKGVEAGESIPTLADRIRGLFEQTYKNRARMVARTEVISAYNGATAKVAEMSPAGITTMEWLATPGSRTRRTHAEADGQRVPVGNKFQIGSAQLEYPGDPSGPAKEIINCRCTLTLLMAADLESDEASPRWTPKT